MFHVYASFVKCERGVSSSAYIRISVHRIRPVRGTVLRCCRPQHFSFLSGAAVLICPFTLQYVSKYLCTPHRCLLRTRSLRPVFWLCIKRSGCFCFACISCLPFSGFRLRRVPCLLDQTKPLLLPSAGRSCLHTASLFLCTASPATCVALEQVRLPASELPRRRWGSVHFRTPKYGRRSGSVREALCFP